MIALVPKRAPRAGIKRRQWEIEQCLAACGLTRGPRRLRGVSGAAPEGLQSRRLRTALERLGPVFSSFGIYLSSRVDLLPAKDCLELAAIPDRAEATPMAAVRELLGREIGCSPEEAYLHFEAEPFESRLLFQSHRAWLHNDTTVTVKVVHPDVEEQIEYDVELLPLLKEAVASGEWAGLPVEAAIADFRRTLQQQINFAHEAEAMDVLAKDAKEFELLRVPTVQKDLCSSKVLTIERLSDSSLGDVIPSFHYWESGEGPAASAVPGAAGIESRDLARYLCLAWLRQALLGRLFPVEPRPDNLAVLPSKQIALTGGAFASLPSEAKTNLWDYLIAAATQDPNKACSSLLREMDKGGRAVSENELQHRFRQVVPFRDGGWNQSDESDSLAEHLFVHWRLASECGYRPRPHLLGFYRGLFLIAAVARRLAPGRDPLLEGLEDLRLMAGMAQFRELISLRQWGENMDKYATIMMELPRKLDEVLTLAAEGSARLKLQVTETAEHRRQKNSLAVVIALLLLLTAVVLLSHHLAASAISGVWVERISAIVFVLLGALLLRAASRTR